ncbi:MFS transporter [Winogradskyella litoriviva]|uniref:MFS transporter n=1 Tax=Winogradskyella litoriviva TaxID=1220182 RepID=A0ABX2E7C7_9FLAO|nr:MFS transporter [Winogradskyella litoriviva]NRD23931.1 MFS transporter [Winogradskyella litoriviva]
MNEKLKPIKVIHLAICAGIIVAYIILGNLTSVENFNLPKIDTSSIIYLMIPIMAIILSNLLYNNQLKKVDTKLKLEEKIPFYQTASIIRLAILEGAAFLILFLKPDFIVLGLVLILYIIYLRPSENQFRNDFNDTRL